MTATEWLQIFCTNLWILFLIILAASGAGMLLLGRFDFDSGLERLLFSIMAGLGACALIIFGLAILGALYRPVLIGLTAAGAGLAVFRLLRGYRAAVPDLIKQVGREVAKRRGVTLLAATLAVGYWGLLILPTQYPPHHWDATSNHLVLVRDYLSNHRITVHEGIPVPALASLNHLLFAWGVALKDDAIAQMLSHAFMIMTALGLYRWGKSEACAPVGLAAAFLWLGHPLVLWLGESAYIDIGATTFVFFGIYALRKQWLTRNPRWWYLGMALLGVSAGVKLSGLVFIAIGGALGIVAYLRTGLPRAAVIGGPLLALAVAAPAYIFIIYHTGNPFWPAMPALSRGAWANEHVISFNREVYVFGVGKTLWNFFLLPFQMVLHPEWFLADNNRPLSPLLVLFPVTWVAAFRSRPVRWCVLWALAFTVIWFASSQQMRLWVPALPLVGLAVAFTIALIFERLSLPTPARAAAWSALMLFTLAYGAGFIVKDIRTWGWPYLGVKATERFLSSFYRGYTAAQFINRNRGDADVVLVINGSWLNYYLRPKVIDVQGLLQRSNKPAYRLPEDSEWERRMDELGVEWILLNHLDMPRPLKLPTDSPDWKPPWNRYVLVFETPSSRVYRRARGDAG